MRHNMAICCLVVVTAGVPGAAATYYVNPRTGGDNGDGSAERPWKTLEQVAASGRLEQLEGGDVVQLATGYHGAVEFSGENEKTITIEAGPEQRPRLSRLVIGRGRNWHIRYLVISPSFGEKPCRGSIVSYGEAGPATDMIVEGCFIFTEQDASDWTAKQWMAANSGVYLGRHGRGLVLRDSYILNTRFAVSLAAFDAVCEGNVIDGFSADGVRATRDGQHVRHNVIKNIFVGSSEGDKNHDDGIQVFLFNKGTGTVRDISIVGNIIIDHEMPGRKHATVMQGIGLFDGPLLDFVVSDNVVKTRHWHGVSLYDAQNCTVERNVAYTDAAGKMKPWIMLGDKHGKARDNTVRNNYAHRFRLDQPGTVAENNQPVTAAIYRQALERAFETIAEKYGRRHETADRPRLGE